MDQAVVVVNTSRSRGMPNLFLEAAARDYPPLTLDFDPGGRIAANDLGEAAGGSFDRSARGADAVGEVTVSARSSSWTSA